MVRTDAGRQVADMVSRGWNPKDAAESYREWLLSFVEDAVDRFVTEDMEP